MRKSGFFPRLALVNLARNGRFYGPYLLSCVVTAAMYYILLFLAYNEGLAVLPARLKEELAAVADGLVKGEDLRADERTEKHAGWAEAFAKNYEITADNALDIVKAETGKVFARVLEHCGVYARTPEGKERFLKFLSTI